MLAVDQHNNPRKHQKPNKPDDIRRFYSRPPIIKDIDEEDHAPPLPPNPSSTDAATKKALAAKEKELQKARDELAAVNAKLADKDIEMQKKIDGSVETAKSMLEGARAEGAYT